LTPANYRERSPKNKKEGFLLQKLFLKVGAGHADWVATPIGRVEMNPDLQNRAFEVIQKKFRASPTGIVNGWGKKVFP